MRASLVPKLALAALALSAALGTPGSGVSAQSVNETFTAFAINMNSGPKTATVDIKIERWSTDAERQTLLGILLEEKDKYKANQALLKALQKMPKAGYIRTPNTLAWDLRYARQNPMEDGGRQIVVGTDRPVGFWEARNQPRTHGLPVHDPGAAPEQGRQGRGQDARRHPALHRPEDEEPRARELRAAARAPQ